MEGLIMSFILIVDFQTFRKTKCLIFVKKYYKWNKKLLKYLQVILFIFTFAVCFS